MKYKNSFSEEKKKKKKPNVGTKIYFDEKRPTSEFDIGDCPAREHRAPYLKVETKEYYSFSIASLRNDVAWLISMEKVE